MRWPGRLAPGLRHEPVWQCDLYPTLLAAAGLPAEARGPLDGINLMPWLLGGQPPADRDFHWHYPYYSNQGGSPSGAIRSGPWKLIEAYESGAAALYNLERDISETVDLSAAEPQRTAALLAALRSWRGALGAVMPRPNPWYESIVAGALPRPNGSGEFPAGTVLPAELAEG
jgi:arylsulfatase A-like enzyme